MLVHGSKQETVPETAFARFLHYANQAAREANCEQRQAIRELAAQHLSVEENSAAICVIMGWT